MNEDNEMKIDLPDSGETPAESENSSESAEAELLPSENTDSIPDAGPEIFNEPVPETVFTENVKKKNSHVFIVAVLVLLTAMITVLTVYLMYKDINTGSIKFNEQNNFSEKESLISFDTADNERNIEYKDENGKYTTEGLAQYIRPQIVEIYAFNSDSPGQALGSGSGIIMSEDGYIVTNTHVLDAVSYSMSGKSVKADSFNVVTYNGLQYDGKIVGRDTKTDIAVIKIDAENLPCARFGNSDKTVLGERVAAIGNPAGLTGSITDGIVSGLNRKIKADSTGFEMNCIQTDAAISPGNSGGALVNMDGEVIGITSSKYVNSSYEGLGFAITINEAKPIIDELISQGYVSGRVRVGITFYSMDNTVALSEFREKYGRTFPESLNGIWITEISDECDVSNTELKVNDFILKVDGKKVRNYDELNAVIKGKKAGDTIKAECARIDENMDISYFEIKFKLMGDTSGDF